MAEGDKRLFLIVSDLHLGRGRITKKGELNYREDFIYDEDFRDFLRWWMRKSQLENLKISLVLNGDILDVIKSTHRNRKVYKRDVFEFVDECCDGHKIFFESLRDFQFEGGEIIYIVGNHDQAIASDDMMLFLTEKSGVSFKFFKKEFFYNGLWIEHGNRYEVVNRADYINVWIKDEKGEEILNMPWGSRFVVEVIDSFSFNKPYLDRWRPLGKALKWGLIFDTKISLLAILKTAQFVLKNRKFYDPVRRRHYYVPMNLVIDAMGHKIVDKSALVLLRRRDVQAVVMGHTHKALIVKHGEKIYVNSGTWTPYVSFDAPHIGLVEKKSFVVAEKIGKRWDVNAYFWKGESKIFEEVRDVMHL